MSAPPPGTGLAFADGPVFLRKLPRKNILGDPTAPLDQWAALVAEAVFLCDPHPYSLFRVEDAAAFARVAVGYNGGRTSLLADLDWWEIRTADLVAVNITPARTRGQTGCHFANARHFDLPATPAQLGRLCALLLQSGRPVVSLRRTHLRPWAERATQDGCLVIPESTACRAAGCTPS